MIAYRYPLIAREGWMIIAIISLLGASLWIFAGLVASIPVWLLVIILLFIFRDPAREISSSPLAIIGPVDGRIEAINKVRDPYADRDAVQIVIQMRILDIHSVRSPTEGKVIKQWHGTKSDTSEQLGQGNFAQWVQTDEGDDVVMVVKQHYPLIRPSCYLQSGERVGQGQRCGFVPFSATIEVYLPENARIEVEQGNRLAAGSDIIATLVRTHVSKSESSTD